jgi:hypothetical protein
MDLDLTRVDYLQVGLTHPKCASLLPSNGIKAQQKVKNFVLMIFVLMTFVVMTLVLMTFVLMTFVLMTFVLLIFVSVTFVVMTFF